MAPVTRGTRRLVLKLGVPNDELRSEAEALEAFAGRGMVGLVDADVDGGAL